MGVMLDVMLDNLWWFDTQSLLLTTVVQVEKIQKCKIPVLHGRSRSCHFFLFLAIQI